MTDRAPCPEVVTAYEEALAGLENRLVSAVIRGDRWVVVSVVASALAVWGWLR